MIPLTDYRTYSSMLGSENLVKQQDRYLPVDDVRFSHHFLLGNVMIFLVEIRRGKLLGIKKVIWTIQ